VRAIAREVCHAYYAQREALGFPLLKEDTKAAVAAAE
jgi:glycyl-tRNA synthetase alpha subunit